MAYIAADKHKIGFWQTKSTFFFFKQEFLSWSKVFHRSLQLEMSVVLDGRQITYAFSPPANWNMAFLLS